MSGRKTRLARQAIKAQVSLWNAMGQLSKITGCPESVLVPLVQTHASRQDRSADVRLSDADALLKDLEVKP